MSVTCWAKEMEVNKRGREDTKCRAVGSYGQAMTMGSDVKGVVDETEEKGKSIMIMMSNETGEDRERNGKQV